ncbi:hypothetical protein E0L17_05600 [Olsenella sp. SW781]|uniref:hypothetical protein n=1 Tax=Olsenella sp. SW781 TaxID=2530046 RepID=UPI00143C79A1|nr:hypothetical protein [Olsenella sp. SW781]NJE80801.1 hypothetical protein [Olsenella sp. SW781]
MGDLREEEVRELARRPPGHVGERHAHAALDRRGRGPGGGELGQARDRADELEVGAAALGPGNGDGELRPHRDAPGAEAAREVAPRGGGVGRHDGHLGRALPREAPDLAGHELGARRRAGGQQHAHGAPRPARARVGPEERGEKGVELPLARDRPGHGRRAGLGDVGAALPREAGELGRERLAPGERRAGGLQGHERHRPSRREPGDKLARGAGHLGEPGDDHRGHRRPRVMEQVGEARHDLALLDEARGGELRPVGSEQAHERALRRARPLGGIGVEHPGKAAPSEACEERGGARGRTRGAARQIGRASEDARAEDLARDGVDDAATVPPDLPALLGPGGGGGDGDAESEPAPRERALRVERLGEARDEQRRAPALRERPSQRPLDGGADEGLLGCSHDMQRHAILTTRRFFSPEIVPQGVDGKAVTHRRRCGRGPSGSRPRGR